MTEEIKYYKEKEYPLKWIPAEELEETPQQTIDRLKQENEKLKGIVKDQCHKCRIGDTTEDNYRKALEEIRKIILTYESKEWNCFNDMDVKLEQISKVINEVMGKE